MWYDNPTQFIVGCANHNQSEQTVKFEREQMVYLLKTEDKMLCLKGRLLAFKQWETKLFRVFESQVKGTNYPSKRKYISL